MDIVPLPLPLQERQTDEVEILAVEQVFFPEHALGREAEVGEVRATAPVLLEDVDVYLVQSEQGEGVIEEQGSGLVTEAMAAVNRAENERADFRCVSISCRPIVPTILRSARTTMLNNKSLPLSIMRCRYSTWLWKPTVREKNCQFCVAAGSSASSMMAASTTEASRSETSPPSFDSIGDHGTTSGSWG